MKFTLTMTPTSPKLTPLTYPQGIQTAQPTQILHDSCCRPNGFRNNFSPAAASTFAFQHFHFVTPSCQITCVCHVCDTCTHTYINALTLISSSVFREKRSSLTMAPSCGVCQLITLKCVTSVYFRKKMTPSQGILVLRNYVEVSWRVSFWGEKCFEIILKDVCLKNYSIYTWAVI